MTTFAVEIQSCFVMKKIDRETKLTIQVALSTILVLAGIVLLFLGFAVAPKGEIHNSVLVASGEAFTFAGALLGIEYAARTAVLKIKQELEDDSKK